jgi:hypothetical protein
LLLGRSPVGVARFAARLRLGEFRGGLAALSSGVLFLRFFHSLFFFRFGAFGVVPSVTARSISHALLEMSKGGSTDEGWQ